MTEMLQQAIDRLQNLPEDRQNLFAHRILARLEEEQRKEADFLAALDKGLHQLNRGESSPLDMEEVIRRNNERWNAARAK